MNKPVIWRRPRPADGGVVWHPELNAFECLGCVDFEPVRGRRSNENPETLARIRELLVLDHSECWEYIDPRMARLARRFRKGLKREQLLAQQKARNMHAER